MEEFFAAPAPPVAPRPPRARPCLDWAGAGVAVAVTFVVTYLVLWWLRPFDQCAAQSLQQAGLVAAVVALCLVWPVALTLFRRPPPCAPAPSEAEARQSWWESRPD